MLIYMKGQECLKDKIFKKALKTSYVQNSYDSAQTLNSLHGSQPCCGEGVCTTQ